MLAAPLGDDTVLYDLVTEVAHRLNPSAGLLWAACDGTGDLDGLARVVADASGADPGRVRADLVDGVARLTTAGLLGRDEPVPVPATVERTPASGRHAGTVHRVLDDGVAFRSDDRALLDAVDRLLAPLATEGPATVELGVHAAEDGTVTLTGWGPARSYASVAGLLDAAPTALNAVAAASTTCLALHAGCAWSTTGEVLVLPGRSGSGKSTLTAALVRAGWDYASDEAVGLRAGSLAAVAYPKPLVLDPGSRAVLGLPEAPSPNVAPADLRADVRVATGEVGPVTRLVLPRYEPGATAALEPLAPADAVMEVLAHALNLARVGEAGLAALCQLAETVPVARLVHGGVGDAVALLAR